MSNRSNRIEAEARALLNMRHHPGVDMTGLRDAVDVDEPPWQLVLSAPAEMGSEERSRTINAARVMWPPNSLSSADAAVAEGQREGLGQG